MKTPKNTEWEGLVDSTCLGLMARYLRSPRSPIEYLVHVKDRDRLCEVAGRIDRDLAQIDGDGDPHRLVSSVEALSGEGAVKVSSRRPVENPDASATAIPERIRSSASCDVVYLPPYYVAHTPGLFEGEPTVQERPTQDPSAASPGSSQTTTAQRTKDEGHEQDQ